MAPLAFRDATVEDLPDIVAMLADDDLGRAREDPRLPLAPGYLAAFAAIEAAPDQSLIVVSDGARIVGTLQLRFLPGLSSRGAWRGQIEGVRVVRDRRGEGVGEALARWAIARCRERGCHVVQLTSDRSRSAAHRFWERLGFSDTHRGYKLALDP